MRVYNRCRHIMWQTVFVFGDSSVERVDTPEPTMELDRAARVQAQKERKKERKKAYCAAKRDHINAYNKAYRVIYKDTAKTTPASQTDDFRAGRTRPA